MQQASSTSLDITEPMLAGSILLRAFSPSRFASPFAQVVGSFRVPFGFSCSYPVRARPVPASVLQLC